MERNDMVVWCWGKLKCAEGCVTATNVCLYIWENPLVYKLQSFLFLSTILKIVCVCEFYAMCFYMRCEDKFPIPSGIQCNVERAA